MQFIGYVSYDYNEENFIPVATGETRDECLEKTTVRALKLHCLRGMISVQQRDDVSIRDYASLTHKVDKFFEEGVFDSVAHDPSILPVASGAVAAIHPDNKRSVL